MLKPLVLISVSLTASVFGALPPDAEAMLQALPNKKLSLGVITRVAIQASDSYRKLTTQREGASVAVLEAAGATDASLRAEYAWQEDRRAPTPPFGLTRDAGHQLSLGVSKLWDTGTTTRLDMSYGYKELSIPGFPGFENGSFTQARVTLGVSQSLWRDAFGSSTRANQRGAEFQSRAENHAFRAAREDWFLQIASLYHEAWLAQAQLRAAEATLVRKERLLRIVRMKLKRGTAERPDYLQLENGRVLAALDRDRYRQRLADRWTELVSLLRLPASFSRIDPLDIPLVLDETPATIAARCQAQTAPDTTTSIKAAVAYNQAAEMSTQGVRSAAKPDLQLKLQLGTNGVADGFSSPLPGITGGRFPYYAAGVELVLPFGNYAAMGATQRANLQQIRADADLSISRDKLRVDWLNQCAELARLSASVQALETATKTQNERELLEEERFSVGRSPLLGVIQAGDDAAQTEIMYKQAQSDHRLTAWRVQRLTGAMDAYLEALEKEARP